MSYTPSCSGAWLDRDYLIKICEYTTQQVHKKRKQKLDEVNLKIQEENKKIPKILRWFIGNDLSFMEDLEIFSAERYGWKSLEVATKLLRLSRHSANSQVFVSSEDLSYLKDLPPVFQI